MTAKTRLGTLLLVATLLLAACGGGDADEQLPDTATPDSSTTTSTEPPEPTPEAPNALPAPTLVPDDPIDTTGIGPVVDGVADDGFDRCSVFTPESLSGLLGEMWALGSGGVPNTGPAGSPSTVSCTWSVGEGEDLAFVQVSMAGAGSEFDPRLGDSAATAVPDTAIDIGDMFYEITGSTYGPGVAFVQGDVGVLVHVIWGTPNTDSRIAVERESELRIAENLSSRLPASG